MGASAEGTLESKISLKKMTLRYIKELFATWWGRFWVLLSICSTGATYVVALRPNFVLYRWIPFSLSAVAWIMAPFDLYRRQIREIESLNRRLADLNEQEKAEDRKRDLLAQWKPQHSFEQSDKGQELILESEQEFEVTGIDYLNADSIKIESQTIGASGKRVAVPIKFAAIDAIRRVGPVISDYDLSATVLLRVHLWTNGFKKEYVIKSLCKPDDRGTVRLLG